VLEIRADQAKRVLRQWSSLCNSTNQFRSVLHSYYCLSFTSSKHVYSHHRCHRILLHEAGLK
jgi:hypothetical protein